MQYEPQAEQFDIEEARRVLGDVFAPWVQDLGLSIGSIECAPPQGAAADWQPGAILRMALLRTLVPARRSRLRSGADGAGRHLNGDRDPCGEPRIPADDDRRSNHALHARRHLV